MSSRNRQRPSHNQDADEERRLWKGIQSKARDIDAMVAKSNDLGAQILALEQQQAAHISAADNEDDSSDPTLDERLEKLYRENLKLCEQVNHVLEGSGNDMNLLDSINILAGLREASEELQASLPLPERRAASGAAGGKLKKIRGASGTASNSAAGSGKASGSATASVAGDSGNGKDDLGAVGGGEESAAPSPKVRLGVPKEKSSRSGSVATTREASVKIEDGVESVASSTDTTHPAPKSESAGASQSATGGTSTAGSLSGGPLSASGGKPTNRIQFRKGEIVFYRHKSPTTKHASSASTDPSQEGEGILCTITSVIGEGKQRRYEVQDVDPSDSTGPIRVSVSQLISIPSSNKGLPDLLKGRGVLAQYPDTTTFYRAVVSTTWRASEVGKGGVERGEMVRLRFDGEENENIESEVERKLVLLEK